MKTRTRPFWLAAAAAAFLFAIPSCSSTPTDGGQAEMGMAEGAEAAAGESCCAEKSAEKSCCASKDGAGTEMHCPEMKQ